MRMKPFRKFVTGVTVVGFLASDLTLGSLSVSAQQPQSAPWQSSPFQLPSDGGPLQFPSYQPPTRKQQIPPISATRRRSVCRRSAY